MIKTEEKVNAVWSYEDLFAALTSLSEDSKVLLQKNIGNLSYKLVFIVSRN
jgi:hypothetical protein